LQELILDDQEVKLRFKSVKKRFYLVVLVTLTFFVGGIALNYAGFDNVNPFWCGLIGVIVFNVGCFVVYRCPKCNAIPFAYGGEGVQLNPKSCAKCGVNFK
jgi:amino acid permease